MFILIFYMYSYNNVFGFAFKTVTNIVFFFF